MEEVKGRRMKRWRMRTVVWRRGMRVTQHPFERLMAGQGWEWKLQASLELH